jgi:hypothetical protein
VIALVQDPGGFDLRELLEKAIQVLVVFFLFGLPVLRGLLESARKARERRAGEGGGARAEREAAEAEARRRWEERLRGEGAGAPAAPAAPPPAPPSRVPLPAEPPPPPPLVVIDSLPGDPSRRLEDAAGDEELSAREELDRRLFEERRRREDFVRLEREAAATRRVGVEPEYVPAFELEVARPVEEAREPAVRRPALAGSGLRAAVIASEVLGRPLALRGGGGPFDRPS